METGHRDNLQRNLTLLVDDLKANQIFPQLIQGDVLSFSEVETIQAEATHRQQAFKTIALLMTKGPSAYPVFLNALEKGHRHLHYALVQTSSQTMSNEEVANKLCKELVSMYTSALQSISPIPWSDWFQLKFEHIYVPLKLIRDVVRSSFEEAVEEEGYDYTLDVNDLFKPVGERPDPKRILVEGDPGIGKSTLCHKLVHEWAAKTKQQTNPQETLHTVHQFDFVLMFSARNLCPEKDVLEAVYEEIFPEDFEVTVPMLKTFVEKNQERVLFVVDGYDEMSSNNSSLEKLITRKILGKSTVLVTSRPSFLLALLKHFDTVCLNVGFTVENQKEYISQFVQERKTSLESLSRKLEEDENLEDACRNPLNLSILCMLASESSCELPDSRTELYLCLQDFILERCAHKLSMDLAELKQQVEPLQMLAYETIAEGSSKVTESSLKARFHLAESGDNFLAHIGFFAKQVNICRFHPVSSYVFTHKSFMEFFAAQHIAGWSSHKRRANLRGLLADKDWNLVCVFVAGLLSQKKDAQGLLDLVDAWQESQYTYVGNLSLDQLEYQKVLESHASHVIFHCLCEVDVELVDDDTLAEIIRRIVSSQGCFCMMQPPYCSKICFSGFLAFCDIYARVSRSTASLVDPSLPKIGFLLMAHCLDLASTIWKKMCCRILKANCTDWTVLHSVTRWSQVMHMLETMKPGEGGADAGIQHVGITFFGIMKEFNNNSSVDFDADVTAFGHWIKSVEILGCKNGFVLQALIEAIPEAAQLQNFRLLDCYPDCTCLRSICEKLPSWTNLEAFSILGHSLTLDTPRWAEDLLSTLQHCTQLRRVEFSHLPQKAAGIIMSRQMSVDFDASFCMFLEKVNLDSLCLSHCMLQYSLISALHEMFTRRGHVRSLELSNCFVTNHSAMDDLVYMFPHLSNLCSLSFIDTMLMESTLIALGRVLPQLLGLQELSLGHLNSDMVAHISAGFTEDSALERVSLDGLGFRNNSVDFFSLQLPKLLRLKHLVLSMHQGHALLEGEIVNLLQTLAGCSSIEHLVLHHFGLRDLHMILVGDMLATNPGMNCLGLRYNAISQDGVDFLCQHLEKTERRLRCLDFSDCAVTAVNREQVKRLKKRVCHLVVNWF